MSKREEKSQLSPNETFDTEHIQPIILDDRPFYTPHPSPDEDCHADLSSHINLKGNLDKGALQSNVCHSIAARPINLRSMHSRATHQDSESSVDSQRQCNGSDRDQQDSSFSHPPVHNWREERAAQKEFFDDGTMTYLWRAHTLTGLLLMVCFLLYEALSPPDDDVIDNTKRGLVAVISCFILLGVTVTPDGPFKRPHPALWRFFFTCSIVYELGLIFVLYQSANTARKILKHLDPALGEPLEEKDYGGNCLLYDPDFLDSPYHNIWDKLDLFVPLHLVGWWCKTLLLRDWWLCWVISLMFEVLEYTLEHQLPNFSECWWDHWIMDAIVCNGLGIYFGLKTLNHFSMKTYHWRGLWNIPSYRGKLRRILGQFGPYVWVDYDWKPFSSLGRWCAVLALIAMFLLVELNTFYLKFVLWIPPGHWVNLCRLLLVLPWGAVALRETFQFLDDPDVDKIGRQSWIFLAIICTELLIVLKFGWDTVTIPFPKSISSLWLGIFVLLLLWTLWNFYIDPHTIKMDGSQSEERRRIHWTQVRAIETKLSPSEDFEEFFNFRLLTSRLKTRITETITTFTYPGSASSDTIEACTATSSSAVTTTADTTTVIATASNTTITAAADTITTAAADTTTTAAADTTNTAAANTTTTAAADTITSTNTTTTTTATQDGSSNASTRRDTVADENHKGDGAQGKT